MRRALARCLYDLQQRRESAFVPASLRRLRTVRRVTKGMRQEQQRTRTYRHSCSSRATGFSWCRRLPPCPSVPHPKRSTTRPEMARWKCSMPMNHEPMMIQPAGRPAGQDASSPTPTRPGIAARPVRLSVFILL